jgi:hypothetical protein
MLVFMGANDIAFSHKRSFRSSLHLFFQRSLFTIQNTGYQALSIGAILARSERFQGFVIKLLMTALKTKIQTYNDSKMSSKKSNRLMTMSCGYEPRREAEGILQTECYVTEGFFIFLRDRSEVLRSKRR